ncbi:MAG: hypothetical protein ACXWH0_03260, partial [Acidimicrobiia bacterium]
LSLFAPVSMTVASGASDSDPQAGFRRDVCHFADDRLPVAQKLRFVHDLLRRESAEVRMLLDHIERFAATLDATDRQSPAVASALDEIGQDRASRSRYLDFARDADEPAIRARMLEVARNLGWLSEAEHRAEMLRMIDEHLAAGAMGTAEVDLFCTMNKDRALGGEHRLRGAPRQAEHCLRVFTCSKRRSRPQPASKRCLFARTTSRRPR